MTAPTTMAKRAAAGTLALAVCFAGGVLGAGAAQAASGFTFDQRISGADRTATSIAAAEARAQCGASDTVIIVERDAVVDGLTASYAAGLNQAPILYVDRQGVPANVSAEIKKLGATKAILVGGTAVLPEAIRTQLESSGLSVTRESGPDRYATAAAVALSGPKNPDKVLVASGEVPADALAAGPIAYAKDYPLVLVRPDSVPDSTQGALNQLGSGERLAIGGTVRISDSTYGSLGDSKRRVSGPNRQSTAIALANIATGELGFAKDRVALVSDADRSAVDALVASPVAGCNLAPLLFTGGDSLSSETTKYLQDHAADLTGTGYVFGGTTAVPQTVADAATASAGGSGTPAPPTDNSAITVGDTAITGQSVGTGTAQSPAVSYGGDLKVSAKLSNTNGSAVSGLNTTLVITGSTAPTVTLPSGATAPSTPTAGATGFSYVIPTDSTGTAVATIQVAAGVEASYAVRFQAPASDSNNQIIENKDSYIQYVTENSLGISPFGDTTTPFKIARSTTNDPSTGNTAVTATLPPLNGSPQKNVQVTFAITGHAFFASAAGAASTTSRTTTAFTDANGQASVFVNDLDAETVTVAAATNGTTKTTVIQYGQAGIATQLDSVRATGTTGGSGTTTAPYLVNSGTSTTLSGVAQDNNGNPVGNATLLITSQDGQGSFTTGTGTDAKTTAFPNATPSTGATVTSTGAPYGALVTTDASGRFSLSVTDSKLRTDFYSVYAVANGVVRSGTALNDTAPITITYNANTAAVSNLGVAVGNGLNAAYTDGSGTAPAALDNVSFPVSDLAANGQFTTAPQVVEFGTFNSGKNDFLFDNPGATVTYQIGADNSGVVGSVDGVLLDGSIPTLPNKPSAVTVKITGTQTTATSNVYDEVVTVNGVAIGAYQLTYTLDGAGKVTNVVRSGTITQTQANFALPTDFVGTTGTSAAPRITSAVNVGLTDAKAETSTFTSTVNGKSATAVVKFSAARVASVTSSPAVASPSNGTAQTITYTAVDANGNPVANAPLPLTLTREGALNGSYITKVNGTTLTQPLGANGAQEPTPIPLGTSAAAYNVSIPGVVTYNSGGTTGTANLVTDADGKVSITVLDTNVSYWNGTVVTTDTGNVNRAIYLKEVAVDGATPATFTVTADNTTAGTTRTTINYS